MNHLFFRIPYFIVIAPLLATQFKKMKNRDYLIVTSIAILFFTLISYALQLPTNATLPQFVDGDPPTYWEAAKLIYTEIGRAHV